MDRNENPNLMRIHLNSVGRINGSIATLKSRQSPEKENEMSVNIKPNGRSSSDGYEWDGKIVKPYGRSSSDGWEFDGRNFKPYGRSSSDGYEWDGRVLKPYGRSSSEGWEANGAVPIPVWALVLNLI